MLSASTPITFIKTLKVNFIGHLLLWLMINKNNLDEKDVRKKLSFKIEPSIVS